ncbi:MAG: 30S ribosomal protein S13 [Euryarchaeota archaeon]|nr:30S ribosomal protein S13 [Euryarchaeota archaeon]MBU4222649.1 30S ribosomal protein S13 [Euryarchaeota archaeon]
MAKKEETKEPKESKESVKDAHKKEAPAKEAPHEGKKEKKEDKKHEGKGEEHAKKERKGAPKEGKKESHPVKEAGPEIKHIVRIADSDLDGKRSVQYALTGITGISRRVAKIVTVNAGLDPIATLGYLTDADIEKLQLSVDNISTLLPTWMMNKQNDILSGDDRQILGTDVMLSRNEDINLMKKVRSYKGVRHDRGLRVRGQRSRSTGRKGKTVGVSRASIGAAQAAAKAGDKKEEKKVEKKAGAK